MGYAVLYTYECFSIAMMTLRVCILNFNSRSFSVVGSRILVTLRFSVYLNNCLKILGYTVFMITALHKHEIMIVLYHPCYFFKLCWLINNHGSP